MTWWKASSVTVTAGQSTVTVNTGDDIGMIKGAEGLVIGNQPPVEIKRSYINASVMMLELMAPWPYANQSGQPAIAFPTDGDLAAATAVLKQLINGFAIATTVQMQAAIDDINPASALKVKQAIDYHRTLTNSAIDSTLGKVLKVGDFGVGGAAVLVPDSFFTDSRSNGIYRVENLAGANPYSAILHLNAIDSFQQIQIERLGGAMIYRGGSLTEGVSSAWKVVRDSSNTTVDSNGFIKAASPIVKLFNDEIVLNGDFTADFERVKLGHYTISGTAGFSDNGWFIETPKDANGNIKVFVEYETLQDNTIVIKTYEPDYSFGKAAAGEPCDIPLNRWIDIRLKESAQVSAISL